MANLQFNMHCTASRPTCVTVLKCCCPDGHGGTAPAGGAPVTILLHGNQVAGGSANGDGVFCFTPCVTGNYTVVLGSQGNCGTGTFPNWSVGECAGLPVTLAQPGKPGYMCCGAGTQVPAQVLISDANGSYVGSFLAGATGGGPDVPHGGDTIQTVPLGLVQCVTEDPVLYGLCCAGFVGGCQGAVEVYGFATKAEFMPASGPVSYFYNLTCGVDEGGTYLQASVIYPFSRENDSDWSEAPSFCCYDADGNCLSGPGCPHDGSPDCKALYPVVHTNDMIANPDGPIPPCVPSNPHPITCTTHAWYGNSFGTSGSSGKQYIGEGCDIATGPWTFTFEPDPNPPPPFGIGVPYTWTFIGGSDCSTVDHTIAPPPPGGDTITISGYFP